MKRIITFLFAVISAFSAYSQTYILNGDSCFDRANYTCAITNYDAAFKNTSGIDKQIAEIKLTRAKWCLEHIKTANEAFSSKNLVTAKDEYQKVLDSNPNDSYAQSQIERCDNKQNPPKLRKATTAELTDISNNKYGVQPQLKQNLINAGIDPDVIVRDLLNYANYYFLKNEYGRALKIYEYVLSLERNNNTALDRVDEIDFLLHRSKIFSYEKTNYSDNVQIKLDIAKELEEITTERSSGVAHIRILFNSDTNGVKRFSYVLLNSNDLTSKEVEKLILSEGKYRAAVFKGYYVMAYQEYIIDVIWNNSFVTIKKKNNTWPENLFEKNPVFNSVRLSTINNWPKGKYKFEVKTKIQTNQIRNDITLVKYKCTSGPQNVILSMILPGLGTRKVVDGNKGLRRSTFFILTAGVSVFAKVISDRTYNEYLIASNQTEIEKLYNKANLTNRVFIVSGSLAASIYLYDIIYVIHKGRTNIKKYKFATPSMVKREPITFN